MDLSPPVKLTKHQKQILKDMLTENPRSLPNVGPNGVAIAYSTKGQIDSNSLRKLHQLHFVHKWTDEVGRQCWGVCADGVKWLQDNHQG